jgi:hypothetical protein
MSTSTRREPGATGPKEARLEAGSWWVERAIESIFASVHVFRIATSRERERGSRQPLVLSGGLREGLGIEEPRVSRLALDFKDTQYPGWRNGKREIFQQFCYN